MSILVKLLAALVLPTIALFTLFAVIAHEVSRRDLDDELGVRLETIAASAATQIRAKYLVDLPPGSDDDRGYQNAVRKLETFAAATGAQLVLFDRAFEARGTSDQSAPLGAYLFRAELDRDEVRAVFERGATASSVTFVGEDGVTYKAGYAPVRLGDDDPRIGLALRAQAPASYFARLDDLRDRLFLWGTGLVAVSILAAVLTTLFITRNIRRLRAAAERIGRGELRERVVIAAHDELGVLAEAMDRMRDQLATRDAHMQQMLAGIAHEVRNPLAGMTLFAGFLRDELPDGDERRGHVLKIQRELTYLERVVSDFLDYARRPRPELATVAVDDLLAELAQLAATDDVAIAVEPSGGLVARADRGQLRRALLNLATNAVHATTDREVRLSARRGEGNEVRLAVSNRGPDIDPAIAGRLFEPFYTTREQGTGLGLAFAREIAIDHGGRIDLASAGGETTFTLVIPG